MLVFALVIILIVVAFLRGNYLLGAEVGLAYAVVAVLMAWLLARRFRHTGNNSIRERVFSVLVLLVTGFVMTYPTTVSPSLAAFVGRDRFEQALKQKVVGVLRSDSAFSALSVTTAEAKLLNVRVKGTLATRAEMEQLRRNLLAECPELKVCLLLWEVRITASTELIKGVDRHLFPEAKTWEP